MHRKDRAAAVRVPRQSKVRGDEHKVRCNELVEGCRVSLLNERCVQPADETLKDGGNTGKDGTVHKGAGKDLLIEVVHCPGVGWHGV